MKYSENLSYMRYLDSKARGDMVSARDALAQCLREPAFKQDPLQHADLLQRMGDLCFDSGDQKGALGYYHEAEERNPDSLLVKYYFAKFLGEKLGDIPAATAKCDSIISIARRNPFPESEDDFGSLAYIRKAEELKSSLSPGGD